MADRRLDNGSDYQIFEHEITPQVERSLFNMSYLHNFTQNFGELRPFYLQDTVPNDKFTLSNDILIRVSPMVVPVLSRIRVFTHYYYSRRNELTTNWNIFITRGRSGTYETGTPEYNSDENLAIMGENPDGTDSGTLYGAFTQDSLANALGLPNIQKYGNGVQKPSATKPTSKLAAGYKFRFDIVPFFMYQRIYRDFYMNQNLNGDDKTWFPDDDEEFRLGTGKESWAVLPTADEDEEREGLADGVVRERYSLFTMRYRNWRDDYFTSAMPWKNGLRGKTPELPIEKEVDLKIPKQYIYANGVVSGGNQSLIRESPVFATPHFHNGTGNTDFWTGELYARGEGTGNEPKFDGSTPPYGLRHLASSWYQGDKAGFTTDANSGLIPEWVNRINGNGEWSAEALHTKEYETTLPISLTLTMEKLRQLSIIQLWMERNSRTDGKYNELIKAHFGFNPHVKDNTPMYIGGTVQDIVVSEILQTSESGETPQGTGTGHAISVGSGYVGEFTAPDYGYIMGIMSIVPDVTYQEGIDKMWTRETFADYYYPEFNGLGPDAIRNKEIKLSTNEEDEKVWAMQERFADMKHRRNRNSGELANELDEYWRPWTFSRIFGNVPSFNNSFVTTKGNIRMDSFAIQNEPPFTVQVANLARAVRPMPYKSIPKGII